MTVADSGYRAIDHTADLAIEAWGPTEEAVLVAAAVGLSEMLMDGPVASGRAAATRQLQLTALDAEDRLVRWLSELLYLASSEDFITTSASLRLTDTGLNATIDGISETIACEIKAVTYHDLSLRHADGQWRARVVFDV